MVKAIWVPSGDQRRLEGPRSTRVICVVAPSASIQRTKIWEPDGWPGAVNAMRVPSGDQTGEDPSRRYRIRDPSAFMIQMPEYRRSFTLSTPPRVKRIWVPSGEIWGLETDSISRKWSRVRVLS
jgi:hypothetical protein